MSATQELVLTSPEVKQLTRMELLQVALSSGAAIDVIERLSALLERGACRSRQSTDFNEALCTWLRKGLSAEHWPEQGSQNKCREGHVSLCVLRGFGQSYAAYLPEARFRSGIQRRRRACREGARALHCLSPGRPCGTLST